MNIEELVEELHNGERRNEVSIELNKQAEENNLVIVFGASDDNMEFRGAIYDEIGAYDGGFAYVDSNGLVTNECDNEDCPHYDKLLQKSTTIEAVWCPKDENGDIFASWEIKTEILHYTFNIYEDEELYCIGIVFSLDDV